MSHAQKQEFATWVYRTVIAVLVSVSLFFGKQSYYKLQAIEQTANDAKTALIRQEGINATINLRLTSLEAAPKPLQK